ncbi:hypothetical protein WR25_25784 [Diploscapter pachys]|uniref:Uncharacterized protein n=1 Tax=Diploscapter pachys TaxID=2018661 RepID=A0A2A2M3K7_9BILA|nr:hypothetical protein WR25_25784 [Diploscapter pachys]
MPPALDLRQPQQRVEDADDRRAFALRSLQHGGILRAVAQDAAQPGERRAQVMRQVAREQPLAADQIVHPVEHAIEAVGLPREHAVQPLRRHASAEVAARDRVCRLLRRGEAHRDQPREHQRHCDAGHCGGQGQRDDDPGQEFVQRFPRLAMLDDDEQAAAR